MNLQENDPMAIESCKNLSISDENIPSELKALKRWVVWKYVLKPGSEKPTKPPFNAATGSFAESNNPATWSTFETACKALETGKYEGLGFMFGYEESNGLTYAGIDLDHLESPEKWEESNQIIKFFDSYAEISPSKQGVHILIKGSKGEGRSRERTKGIEIYDKTHYFTVTGWKVEGAPATVNGREEQLRKFYDKTFSSLKAKNETAPAEELRAIEDRRQEPVVIPPIMPRPVASANPTLSDEEIIVIASRAANGEKFRRLYVEGDISAYGDDDSSADMGLMCLLAFYVKDPAQLERIFSSSALAAREKWQKRADYRKRTVEAALALVKEQYSPRRNLYRQTSNGNADRLVDRFGAELLYRIRMSKSGVATGEWLIWNGNIWKPDGTLEIERLAREIINEIYDEAGRLRASGDEAAGKLFSFAIKNDNIKGLRDMLMAARSNATIARRARDFDINPQLMGLPGESGVILELTDKGYEVRAARKDDMITMAAGVVPARREDPRQPKKWLAFLNLIFKGDKDLIRYIQKLMGYSILGNQAAQLFAVFYGTGANGKSTLVGTWQLIFGDYGTYPSIQTFSKKFDDKETRSDLRAIMKHRLVTPVEGSASIKLDETLINRWTGGQEPITTRDLYESTISEWPQGLIGIVSNNKPIISETNFGIWRRVRLIPFDVNLKKLLKPSELIEEYEKKILFPEEGDLIFSWMLQGYKLYRAEGLESPAAVEEATRKYESESNTLLQFCKDMLILDPEAKIQASELIDAYSKYCISEHIVPMDLRKVKDEITTKIYPKHEVDHRRTKKGIYYIGMRLKTDFDFEMEDSIKEYIKEVFSCMHHPTVWDEYTSSDCLTAICY
jgi:putative DNA primase/helicase